MAPFVEEWLREKETSENLFEKNIIPEATITIDKKELFKLANIMSFEILDIQHEKNHEIQDSHDPLQTIQEIYQQQFENNSEISSDFFPDNIMENANKRKIIEGYLDLNFFFNSKEEQRLQDIFHTFNFEVLWKSVDKSKYLILTEK